MAARDAFHRLPQLVRYYGVGLVNTGFGFGLYSGFVWLGMNMYLAQLTAHVIGVAFNYFTYSRHVFSNRSGTGLRFAISYGLNYLIGLAALAAMGLLVDNPYFAGLGSILIASAINYLMLKYGVFNRPTSA